MPTVEPIGNYGEVLEAQIRRAMHKHAAIKPRGWATIRDRNEIHREIDAMLDELTDISHGAPVHVEPIELHVNAQDCGICGRRRYVNFSGAIACLACDGHPRGTWVGIDGETAS